MSVSKTKTIIYYILKVFKAYKKSALSPHKELESCLTDFLSFFLTWNFSEVVIQGILMNVS